MELIDKQIQTIIDTEFKDEQEKEVWYLIHLVQKKMVERVEKLFGLTPIEKAELFRQLEGRIEDDKGN